MNVVASKDLPSKPTVRYRPKADRLILIQAVQDAWSAKKNEWIEKHEALVGSTATERLELLCPAEDMRVLQKYGVARPVETAGIRIYNCRTDRWDAVYGVVLEHPVVVPGYCAELSALRPQWWSDPMLGIKPKVRREMSAEEWSKAVADNEESKTRQMPTELDPIFAGWLDMLYEYRQDLRISDWIDERRSTEGVYPTWGEIIAHCPVILRAYQEQDKVGAKAK